MIPNEIVGKINSFILFLNELKSIEFNEGYYSILKNEQQILNKYQIEGDEYDNRIQLKLKKYFNDYSVKYGSELNSDIKADDIKNNFIVIEPINKTLIHYFNSEYILYGNENIYLFNHLKFIVIYYRIFNCLKSSNFSDYFNSANNQIVIYSSVKGIYKIIYDTIPKNINTKINAEDLNEFLNIAESIEIKPILKSTIYNFTNGEGIIELDFLISNLSHILSLTKRDYDILIKKFDFEKFKDSIHKEKEKYFINIREIINKIFSQAVSIPISISASVFATYNVSKETYILFLVLLSFLVYVFFYVKIQFIYKSDMNEIKNDFNRDFNIIKTKSGLEPSLIETEKIKINTKITSTLNIIKYLIYIVLFLGILLSMYILYEIWKIESPFL